MKNYHSRTSAIIPLLPTTKYSSTVKAQCLTNLSTLGYIQMQLWKLRWCTLSLKKNTGKKGIAPPKNGKAAAIDNVLVKQLNNLFTTGYLICCCCLPTPMTLARGGGGPMFPLVGHQPASPSIWPAVQSLRRGLSTNPGVTMWEQLKR